jgi:hypothetical protein
LREILGQIDAVIRIPNYVFKLGRSERHLIEQTDSGVIANFIKVVRWLRRQWP